jgi:hypothetical protein
MAAARIRFDKKKGQYEIESYGNQCLKAINVRPSSLIGCRHDLSKSNRRDGDS